jgi:hypothetical protein
MGFKKGEGGRPKGVTNKHTRVFKQAVLAAYDTIGGDEAFAQWATENRTEYYKIAARLLPHEVALSTEVRPLVIDLVTPEDVAQRRQAESEDA